MGFEQLRNYALHGPMANQKQILPWLMAGAGVVKAGMDVYGAEQQRKAQNRALKGQLDALKNLANVTPAERDYVQRRRKIMAEGDPMLKEQFQQATGTIRQQGSFMRQRAQGQVIQQGLEGSIVAQELRRRVDKDVLTSVAEQARQLAMANRQARRQAEGEMEGMNLRTDARKQQAEYQSAVVKGQMQDWDPTGAWIQGLGGAFVGGVDAYARHEGKGTSNSANVSNPTSDVKLKKNIVCVGESNSGINVYEFNYIHPEQDGYGRYRGVMAQEVPYASLTRDDGYLVVDYSKVDVTFERIGE